MNHPLYKMLRFELKINHMWVTIPFWLVMIFLMALAVLIPGHELTAQFVFILTFGILTQQTFRHFNNETQFLHSMQMYLLIPVSQKVKFFSKLFISLVIFPVLFLLTGYISVLLAHFVVGRPISTNLTEMAGYNFLVFAELLILANSVAIFTATVAKKIEPLLFMLAFMVLYMITFLVFWLMGWCDNFDSFYYLVVDKIQNTSGIAVALLSAVFYGLSYHLFFRRQL